MVNKPWHYHKCRGAEIFWEYAKKSVFKTEIENTKRAYTEELCEIARVGTERLIETANKQGKDRGENIIVKRKLSAILNA